MPDRNGTGPRPAGLQSMDPADITSPKDCSGGSTSGDRASSPAQITAKGWKQVALRTWKQSGENNIGLVAAGVAFYAFLALVPMLGATVLTYGLIAAPETVLSNVRSLAAVMPAEAAKLVGEQLMSVVQTSEGKKGVGLLLALAIAMFGARNAAGSVITALNIAYDEEETRGLIQFNLLALSITVVAILLAIMAMIAVAALGHLETMLPQLGGVLLMIGKMASYALLLIGTAAGAAALYRYGPDRKQAEWAWITPGSLVASVGWILLTLGFGFYAANFADYGKTYGSLATVIVLLTWMFLSAYVLLFGAELNSELEHQTSKDTTVGLSRPAGQRGAWSADHVASATEAEEPGCDVSPSQGDQLARKLSPQKAHLYLSSRVAARAGRVVGGARIGMLGSAMATIGLSLLRRKGRAGIGAALLMSAAGLALLRRRDDD